MLFVIGIATFAVSMRDPILLVPFISALAMGWALVNTIRWFVPHFQKMTLILMGIGNMFGIFFLAVAKFVLGTIELIGVAIGEISDGLGVLIGIDENEDLTLAETNIMPDKVEPRLISNEQNENTGLRPADTAKVVHLSKWGKKKT
jgi:hypothetical protein